MLLLLQAQSVGSDVVNKAKNVTSDLSDLPNPFKGNADPQNLANDAKNKAGHPSCPLKHEMMALGTISDVSMK
jgi:hypothetical protein